MMSVIDSGKATLWDCIVIGAGMSGLAASSRLVKAGHRVLVLEARDRIGGRIYTYREGLPCPVDLGARCAAFAAVVWTLASSASGS